MSNNLKSNVDLIFLQEATTIRFLLMIEADKNFEAGLPLEPQEKLPELMAAIGKFSEEMGRKGILLSTDSLAPSSQGMRIFAATGKLTRVNGPFAETKELIAGYALIRADSKEEALQAAEQFFKLHQDVLGPEWEGIGEVRQVFGPSDFA